MVDIQLSSFEGLITFLPSKLISTNVLTVEVQFGIVKNTIEPLFTSFKEQNFILIFKPNDNIIKCSINIFIIYLILFICSKKIEFQWTICMYDQDKWRHIDKL